MSATYDEQYYREAMTVKPLPTNHQYDTEDLRVTMQVFTGIGGPMPLLIFDRNGNRLSIEITAESGDFLLNAVSDALNCLEDHHDPRS